MTLQPQPLPALQDYREAVEQTLAALLEADGQAPERLHEAMRYCLLAPGKRLRPLLVLAAAQASGARDLKALLPPACAMEMIHAYSLIHDDLPCMDDDDLRRGRPTCHRVYGEAVALLAGDALLTLAFEILARPIPSVPPVLQLEIVREVGQAAGARGMVGGQVLDLAAEYREQGGMKLAEAELGRIHRLKTGFLIRASVRLGGKLGGASEAEQERLTEFGEQFGLAFQISDDILDVVGQGEMMGKEAGRDARRGKTTYVSRWGLEGAYRRLDEAIAAAGRALEPLGGRAASLKELLLWLAGRKA